MFYHHNPIFSIPNRLFSRNDDFSKHITTLFPLTSTYEEISAPIRPKLSLHSSSINLKPFDNSINESQPETIRFDKLIARLLSHDQIPNKLANEKLTKFNEVDGFLFQNGEHRIRKRKRAKRDTEIFPKQFCICNRRHRLFRESAVGEIVTVSKVPKIRNTTYSYMCV